MPRRPPLGTLSTTRRWVCFCSFPTWEARKVQLLQLAELTIHSVKGGGAVAGEGSGGRSKYNLVKPSLLLLLKGLESSIVRSLPDVVYHHLPPKWEGESE